MKKIMLLALVTFMMVGCYQANANHDKQQVNINTVSDYRAETIIYQGCEYVVMYSYFENHGVITHKGNCKYCKERRQKELKELIEQLKNR
jgi:hypothetical protein